MRFNPALVSSFLFASAFLFNGVRPEPSIFASSTFKADNDNYESISATFHAPFFFGPDPSYAGVGVIMDGVTCNTTLVAMVSFGYNGHEPFWFAWSMWEPSGQYITSSVPISVGDKITIVIRASSGTSATVTIHNHTNGQSETTPLGPSPYALCRNQVTWFVGTAEDNVLPNFGMVEVMGAKATGVTTGRQEAGRGELHNMKNHTTTLVTTSHASDFSTLIFKQD